MANKTYYDMLRERSKLIEKNEGVRWKNYKNIVLK